MSIHREPQKKQKTLEYTSKHQMGLLRRTEGQTTVASPCNGPGVNQADKYNSSAWSATGPKSSGWKRRSPPKGHLEIKPDVMLERLGLCGNDDSRQEYAWSSRAKGDEVNVRLQVLSCKHRVKQVDLLIWPAAKFVWPLQGNHAFERHPPPVRHCQRSRPISSA